MEANPKGCGLNRKKGQYCTALNYQGLAIVVYTKWALTLATHRLKGKGKNTQTLEFRTHVMCIENEMPTFYPMRPQRYDTRPYLSTTQSDGKV